MNATQATDYARLDAAIEAVWQGLDPGNTDTPEAALAALAADPDAESRDCATLLRAYARHLAGDPQGALQLLGPEGLEDTSPRPGRGPLLRAIMRSAVLRAAGLDDDARATALAAWQQLGEAGPPRPMRSLIRLLLELAAGYVAAGDTAAARAWHEWAARVADKLDAGPVAEETRAIAAAALLAAGDAAAEQGDATVAADWWRQSRDVLEPVRPTAGVAYLIARAEVALRLEEAEPPTLPEGLEYDTRVPSDHQRCRAAAWRARWHARQGQCDAALQSLAHARDLAETAGDAPALEQVLAAGLAVAEALGDPAMEARLLREQRAARETARQAEADAMQPVFEALLRTEQACADAAEARLQADLAERTNQALKLQTEALSTAAQQDPLTGLANRRRFTAEFERRHAVAHGAGEALPLATIDVDHFKRVNDTHGHPAGDAVLCRLAEVFRRECRQGDLVARLGGEEFCIIFARAPLTAASTACERLRQAVEQEDWSALVPGTPVTISLGLVDAARHAVPAEALERSDALLYAAKRDGRNRLAIDDGATA